MFQPLTPVRPVRGFLHLRILRAALTAAGVPSDVADRATHTGGGRFSVVHDGTVYSVHARTYPALWTADGYRRSPPVHADEPGAVLALPERTTCGPVVRVPQGA